MSGAQWSSIYSFDVNQLTVPVATPQVWWSLCTVLWTVAFVTDDDVDAD